MLSGDFGWENILALLSAALLFSLGATLIVARDRFSDATSQMARSFGSLGRRVSDASTSRVVVRTGIVFLLGGVLFVVLGLFG